MKIVTSIFPLWCCFLALMVVSCLADPWPEPDDMQDGDTEQPTNGYSDSDASTPSTADGDADVDADTSKETDTSGSESDVDSGDVLIDSEEGGLTKDRIFISTPVDGGPATVVGLPGAAPTDSTLLALAGGFSKVVEIGREGGFAFRIPNASDKVDVELLLIENQSTVSRTPIDAGTLTERYPGDILGAGKGVLPITDSLVVIEGEGAQLSGGYWVVAADLTRAVGGLAPISCRETGCSFSLVLPAKRGDEIDLFLVPEGQDPAGDDIRAGTVTETVVVD